MKNSLKFATFVLMGLLFSAVPLPADSPTGTPTSARPGTLNYVEGQAYLGQQSLDNKSIGKVEVDPGETLSTNKGKAEILLTPGVFVRLGDDSSANMISTSLTNTQMALDQGEATVEVVEIHPENFLAVVEDGRQTQILKTGLYDFDENLHVVRVLDGEAVVKDARNGVKVKAGHLVDLTSTEPLKAHKFDKKEVEAEDLYHWTSLRSSYLAEANADYAPTYAYGGPGWYGDGWYWDPWFSAYTFMPWDGIFYSPFGWGFYSPWCAYGAPLFWGAGFYGGYGGYGYGYGYGHYPHRFGPDPAHWGPGRHYGNPANYGHGVHYASRSEGGVAMGSRGAFGGGFHGGAFHGGGFHGASGFHGSSSASFHGGGGFHGGGFGGGGFHGGGFGGGFHGGGGGFGGGGGHR
jgi:hypothetical protein